mmetsp:Transcript_10730/g.27098  ORF Transcript_10730/g.27098 Transcript_10730/m.27098 type:complete len:465 (+) Transcript_10730:107-1501(+)
MRARMVVADSGRKGSAPAAAAMGRGARKAAALRRTGRFPSTSTSPSTSTWVSRRKGNCARGTTTAASASERDDPVVIATLPGDGIGPEIMTVARKVLESVSEGEDVNLQFKELPVGGHAIDETGVPLPQETLKACRKSDAVLLAAIGGYKWDHLSSDKRPEGGLLQLRSGLDCYANLRPAVLQKELVGGSPLRPEVIQGVDIMIVRELVGGIYFGEPRGKSKVATRDGSGTERVGFNTMVYRESEIERIAKVAFEIAKKRKGRVVSVDKANVLDVSQLWREVVQRVHETGGYKDSGVELANMYVDNCAMQLCAKPTQFDVILTGNIFGDILSDQASVLTGSLGMLPSASVSAPGNPGIFEPVHGSAPDIAGKDIANPLGMVLSAAMMCRYGLGEPVMADIIEDAVSAVLAAGYRTADLMPGSGGGPAKGEEDLKLVGCSQMGDLLLECIAEEEITSAFMPRGGV